MASHNSRNKKRRETQRTLRDLLRTQTLWSEEVVTLKNQQLLEQALQPVGLEQTVRNKAVQSWNTLMHSSMQHKLEERSY